MSYSEGSEQIRSRNTCDPPPLLIDIVELVREMDGRRKGQQLLAYMPGVGGLQGDWLTSPTSFASSCWLSSWLHSTLISSANFVKNSGISFSTHPVIIIFLLITLPSLAEEDDQAQHDDLGHYSTEWPNCGKRVFHS